MTPQRWREVEDLYHAALDLKPAARVALLERTDPELRNEVESLLAQDGSLPDLQIDELTGSEHGKRDDVPLKPGDRLGSYRIVDRLAAGGMGVVYRALDTQLDREAAIKILPSGLARDADRLARFEREAKVLASLNHPNIAQIYGIVEGLNAESCKARGIAMELVDGANIAGPLPVETAIEYARQIASALEAAHERGIVHRDLKLANIMVTPDGVVKVLDFGLALFSADGTGSQNDSPVMLPSPTRAGIILGTAAYMAPEQARGKVVDKRADIWAFGVVLFEIVTGKRLFSGETVTDILACVLTQEPNLSEMPPCLRRLAGKCLEKDPKKRLRDIGDWEQLIDHEAIAPVRQPVKPRAALWLAVILAIALTAIGATWLGRYTASAPSPSRQITRLTVKLTEGRIRLEAGYPLALSPDGSKLVYSAYQGQNSRLYFRRLDQFRATPIAGTDGGGGPFFSPDGNWLGFYAEGKLKKVALTGGTPVTICDTHGFMGGSWAADGTIVFAPGPPSGLYRVSENGGIPKPISSPDFGEGEIAHIWPDVLPGGEGVVFTIFRATRGFGAHPVAVLSLKGGERKILSKEFSYAKYVKTGDLLCFRKGSVFALPFDLKRLVVTGPPVSVLDGVGTAIAGARAPLMAVSESGSLTFVPDDERARLRQALWTDPEGNAEPLGTPEANLQFPALSPDGQFLAMTMVNNQGAHIWTWDTQRKALSRVTYEGDNHASIWSPDGQWIIFSSDSGGATMNLFRKRANGTGGAERLLTSANHQDAGSFSPDGKFLAYAEDNSRAYSEDDKRDSSCQCGRFAIRIFDMEKRTSRPFVETRFDEAEPMISPDGRWIAYSSTESGRSEVYVQPFPLGGKKWRVSSAGGDQPLWSPDGKRLYYRASGKVTAVEVVPGPEFHPGKEKVLFSGFYQGRSGFGHPNYEVASGGRRFLMWRPSLPSGEGATEINVVLNWQEDLKRLLGRGN